MPRCLIRSPLGSRETSGQPCVHEWRCPLSFAHSAETADAVVTAESDSSGNGERDA